jgi:Flp pilus assembly protein TadD
MATVAALRSLCRVALRSAALLSALLAAPLLSAQTEDPVAVEAQVRRALASQPTDFTLHFNLALALSMQQKDEEAASEYRRTLELKPGLYEANLNLGILLLRDKKPEDAVAFLKDASDARPKEFRPAFFYAEALLAAGDPESAATQYRNAVDADQKSAAAEFGLGRALLRQSNLPEALEHLRVAATLDPRYHDALLDVAEAYEKDGKLTEAIEIYREFPNNAAVQQHMGTLLSAADNFAAAIPHLETTVKSAPTTANRMALADAYRMNKQTARALEQLQLAVAADPSNFDLRMTYGKILRDEHQLSPAAQQFSSATKIQPTSVKAWNELAVILVIGKDYPDALGALDHVHALGQEGPGDYFYRAISLDHLHQLKPARDAYRQFLMAAAGKLPDQEFQARQRIRIIENELNKR